MQLGFIQSNWLRQYPFRAEHGAMDLLNNHMPTDLIVALRITCVATDLDVYIDKVVTNNGIVSVSFCGAAGALGYANGKIKTSNQSLPIRTFSGGIIGNVTIGNIDSTVAKQSFIFNATNGLVEASTILVMAKPVVKSLSIKGKNITGAVVLTSKTLNISTDTSLNISALYPLSITSRGDISSQTLTCGNPVISGINNVTPNLVNNIDIYAIEPLTITTAVVDGITQLKLSTPTLGFGNLCKSLNLPPADAEQISHTSIAEIEKPEWTDWP